ncbi:hypothetical protein PNEG_01183 [Pneumocystis murina B123]|uniref:Uncharacterized protein n=1 Tax=Pneumocystis murina (strain B123) TaxID=1069680 RepID=M7PJ39_PNEMU|nr:hypothetical protein PNEG_01183 [Pneumocystis murina B123]EMR10469.1 hypothetical protein PNEG_01183 [Pneumocystis murina B123]
MGLIISIFKTVRFMPTTLPTYPDSARHTLEYLIRANHTNVAVIHESGRPNMFLQHIPVLYLLNTSSKYLLTVYDQIIPDDCPWKPSPSVVTQADWQMFFGNLSYAEAYKHYFDDELIHMNRDQLKTVQFYAQNILIPSLLEGDMYSTIHLGLSFILKSREMMSEALVSMCLNIHKSSLLDQEINTHEWKHGTYTLQDLLSKVAEKERIKKQTNHADSFTEKRSVYISHYVSKWDVQDSYKSLKEIQKTTLLLAIATSESILLPFLSFFNASQTLFVLSQNKVISESQIRISLQAILFHLLLNYISLNTPCIQSNKVDHYPSVDMNTIRNDPKLIFFNTEKLLAIYYLDKIKDNFEKKAISAIYYSK